MCGVCERHRCFCVRCESECIDSFFENRIPLGEDGYNELIESISEASGSSQELEVEIDKELDAELDPDYQF